jgi:hypothetical protein
MIQSNKGCVDMSDRGSFVTEYIYCDKCLEIAKEHLIQNGKYLKGIQIPGWQQGEDLPIIAGKIGSSGSGDTYDVIEQEVEEMAKKVCHDMRISVIPEIGNPSYIMIDSTTKLYTLNE